ARGARRRDDRDRGPRWAARGDALAARHRRPLLRLPGGRDGRRVSGRRAADRARVLSALAGAAGRPAREGRAVQGAGARRGLGGRALGRRRLARAGGVRHVRCDLPRPPGPATDPHVGDLRRGISAAEGLPAAGPIQPRGAGAPGAGRQSRGALLDGRAVHRRSVRGAPRGHEAAAAPGRARQNPLLRMNKRTVELELATPGLMGIAITPRCTVLRVIACEMSRVISHMVWLGTTAIDLGAFTPFLWAFQERERIYDLQEMWTGARLTTSVTRVGGMMADIPDAFVPGLRHFTETFPKTLH